jgi:coproporphyrinogen III oxidase
MTDKTQIATFFQDLQNRICQAIEQADGKAKFQEDVWNRPGGGGGHTRILQEGNVIEKGGVNFSAVHGEMPLALKEKMNATAEDFFASGVSIVMHPHNPHVPIIHMNIRYFEMSDGTYWFGGGIDLTPHYIVDEDARFFHESLKETCDAHHPEYYPKYKKWADDYFYIPHREETRGIGGIFFDRLKEGEGKTKEQCFEFVKSVGETFAPIYTYLMSKNKNKPFIDTQKNWQLLRRGRYVEFNLVYDQGTKFGLETAGRIESILMSLPKYASWQYDIKPQAKSQEAYTLSKLKKEINWLK